MIHVNAILVGNVVSYREDSPALFSPLQASYRQQPSAGSGGTLIFGQKLSVDYYIKCNNFMEFRLCFLIWSDPHNFT